MYPGMNTNYTVAEHRRRGPNTLMMEWSTRQADELGLEIWLEKNLLGSILYVKHGFGLLHTVDLYASAELHEDNAPLGRGHRKSSPGRDEEAGQRCVVRRQSGHSVLPCPRPRQGHSAGVVVKCLD